MQVIINMQKLIIFALLGLIAVQGMTLRNKSGVQSLLKRNNGGNTPGNGNGGPSTWELDRLLAAIDELYY